MTQQTINIGSTPNRGDGDPLRLAFTKINENFTELYTANAAAFDGSYNSLADTPTIPSALSQLTNDLDYSLIVGTAIQNNGLPVLPTQTLDITGSVFADDSSLLVDAVSGTIPGYVSISQLQAITAASTDFADFQARIASL